jgi:hypothetical protein
MLETVKEMGCLMRRIAFFSRQASVWRHNALAV